MFGKNEIVGQKFFKDAPKDSLFVTSVFFTIQGEGPFRGLPAVFVRLAKCNLACTFCDTFFDGGDWLTYDQINDKIERSIVSYFESKNMNVPKWASNREMVLVMTGGEPMLQSNIGDFLRSVGSTFRYTQIESNGTYLQNIPDNTVLVVSPKCLEKNGQPVKYLNVRKEVLDRANCLKFVMCNDNDSPYSTVPDWVIQWKLDNPTKDVFVSPMNIYNREPQKAKQLRSEKDDISIDERSTVDEVIEFWEEGLLDMKANELNHKHTAHYCMNHGFILNLQIHLYAGLA